MNTPCVNICKLAPDGSYCTGCTRTASEIAGWVSFTDEERQKIMQRCLDHVWGTKCDQCMGWVKQTTEDDLQQSIDNLGKGLF